MVYVFAVPDASPTAVATALSRSLAPVGAEVRIDASTGLVSVTTPGVWQADRAGQEQGVGVPGWGLVFATAETVKAPEQAAAEARIVLEKSAPVVLPKVDVVQVAKVRK